MTLIGRVIDSEVMLPVWVVVVFTVEYFLLAFHISVAICVACELRKGTLLNSAFFAIYILQTGADVADYLVLSHTGHETISLKCYLITGDRGSRGP